VPRGTSVKLARALGRSAELINSWRRPPVNIEDPYGTGINNPLDIVEALQDHAFAHAPTESHRIHLYLERRYEDHFAHRPAKPLTAEERDKEISDVVREHAEMLRAVLEKLPADRVRKEWEDLKREGEELVSALEAQAAGKKFGT
jgi:glutathione S-transferase